MVKLLMAKWCKHYNIVPLIIFLYSYCSDFIMEGFGILCDPGGDRYEGKFTNDIPDGFGTIIYANGDSYVGEVQDMKK